MERGKGIPRCRHLNTQCTRTRALEQLAADPSHWRLLPSVRSRPNQHTTPACAHVRSQGIICNATSSSCSFLSFTTLSPSHLSTPKFVFSRFPLCNTKHCRMWKYCSKTPSFRFTRRGTCEAIFYKENPRTSVTTDVRDVTT